MQSSRGETKSYPNPGLGCKISRARDKCSSFGFISLNPYNERVFNSGTQWPKLMSLTPAFQHQPTNLTIQTSIHSDSPHEFFIHPNWINKTHSVCISSSLQTTLIFFLFISLSSHDTICRFQLRKRKKQTIPTINRTKLHRYRRCWFFFVVVPFFLHSICL